MGAKSQSVSRSHTRSAREFAESGRSGVTAPGRLQPSDRDQLPPIGDIHCSDLVIPKLPVGSRRIAAADPRLTIRLTELVMGKIRTHLGPRQGEGAHSPLDLTPRSPLPRCLNVSSIEGATRRRRPADMPRSAEVRGRRCGAGREHDGRSDVPKPPHCATAASTNRRARCRWTERYSGATWPRISPPGLVAV